MTFFMSDNIFISWSKSKSREFAFEVKNLLETLNPHLNIFMSEDNISAGEKVQEKIIQKISECDKVLLCFTRDNKKSPWLLYEAGYACGQNKMVIPLLFDEDPNWHSWIDNPMNIAREININSISFEESFIIVLIYVIPFILENYFQILLKELMKFEKNIVKLMLNAKILLIYLFQIIHLELKALYTEIKLPIF